MELRALDNAVPASQLRPATTESGAAAVRTGAAPVRSGAAAKTEAAKPAPEPSDDEVTKAVGDINQAMQALSRNIEFSIDADSKRTVVKVIDQQTKEVIRQMPTAEALEIGKALAKVQGLLIHQTA